MAANRLLWQTVLDMSIIELLAMAYIKNVYRALFGWLTIGAF